MPSEILSDLKAIKLRRGVGCVRRARRNAPLVGEYWLRMWRHLLRRPVPSSPTALPRQRH